MMDDADGHLYQESKTSDGKAVKTQFSSQGEAKKFMRTFVDKSDDDDDNPDPREKGLFLTTAKNVKSRLKAAFVPCEQDFYVVQNLVKNGKWDSVHCKDLYYEYTYYNANGGWYVVTSQPVANLRRLARITYKAYKKKRCKGAFTPEELKTLQELYDKVDKFYNAVMTTYSSRGPSAEHRAETAGKLAVEFCDNAEKYEAVIGLG